MIFCLQEGHELADDSVEAVVLVVLPLDVGDKGSGDPLKARLVLHVPGDQKVRDDSQKRSPSGLVLGENGSARREDRIIVGVFSLVGKS